MMRGPPIRRPEGGANAAVAAIADSETRSREATFLEAEKNYRDGRTAYQHEKFKEAVHHFIVA